VTPSELGAAVRAAVGAAVDAGELAVGVPDQVSVERPRVKEHGDYATSVALQLAKPAGRPPREVAELLATRLRTVPGIDEVHVAGPGFLNLRLAQASLGQVVHAILGAGASYGTNDAAAGQRVNLEFVSANPTGPVHVGSVRWAAVGDAVARLLQASGAEVTREYYVNDAGLQIDRFAESLLAAAKGQPVPEDGYAGAYVPAVAARVLWRNPGLPAEDEAKVLEVLRNEGTALMVDDIRRSLASFGVEFDVWFSELSLATSGAVDRALERLRSEGHVYEADGAVWLRTTDFGDDKDRVLVKSGGETTYFTSDAAYYLDKRGRGFDKVVIMLGADHHGYIGRMRAMVSCFGDDPDATLELPIGQLVNVLQGGQPIRMSKRAGNLVTLEDLVELVGVDAARYTLARSSTDSTMDLDVDVVTRRSSDNPVFYVQYAATRAASVLRNAVESGVAEPDPAAVDLSLLAHPRESELLLALAEFPKVVATAAELREPHRVARYLEEKVAKSAQRFWDDCQVLPKGDEEVAPTTAPRLLLWRATRVVLENGLRLLGVTAPERM
jgi:arginyl-tRNA synthetase